MNLEDAINQAAQSIKSAKKIVIILPPEPTQDQVSAALTLHLSLNQSGKESQIGCETILSSLNIYGIEHIKDSIGSKNLIISFDYQESDLEKVDYDIKDDGRFYLVVKPKANAPVPDISSAKFTYSGADADLAIVLGIFSLEELGRIYSEEKIYIDSANILSISNNPRPAQFACQSLHYSYNSYSELIALVIESASLDIPQESASELINAIYSATTNLTSAKTSPETFSSISLLMKHGGRLPSQHSSISKLNQPAFFDSPFAPHTPPEDSQTEAPIPSDWKRPKIFRGGDFPAAK